MLFIKKYILLIGIATVSCNTIKIPADKALPEMPEKIGSIQDSMRTSPLAKNLFFTDEKLIQLIDTALKNNTDLLNAFQNIEIAKANMMYTKGLLKPTVNASFAPGIQKFGEYTMDGAGNKGTPIYRNKNIPVHLPDYFAGFQAAWEPDVWKKIKNKKKAAASRYLSGIEGSKWLQANLVNAVANLYYELVALDEQAAIISSNIIIQEKVLEIIKIQKEAARSNELAVNQFHAQILNSKAMLKETELSLVDIENNINLLLSSYPGSISRQKNLPQFNDLPMGFSSELLRNRPDIRSAELELSASKFDLMSARQAFYPTLRIDATLGLQAFSPATFLKTKSLTYGIFGGMLAPVFNRSALKAEFKTQSSLQLQALNNYQQVMITAFGEVFSSLKKITSFQQMIELKKEEVAVLEKAIENAALLFQANRADYLEVLTAQQNLLEAKIDLLNTNKLKAQENINLFKATGGNWN